MIRDLYKPIQPTINRFQNTVIYDEFLPSIVLQDYIYCYWQLKTTEKLTSQFNYKVVADGCIDIFFELNSSKKSFVMGFCKKYTEFPLESEFNYIGIRFLPTMFPQLFNVNASELSNKFESLESIVPKTFKYISVHFHKELNRAAIKILLDEHFSSIILKIDFDLDSRLYNAINIILKNYGVLNVTEIDTGISDRQLRRLFRYYIGDTAKTFSKVVRFQNILKAKPSNQSLKNNKLFYDIGYYDQSHFIKDFKNFYGVTPSKVFQR